MLNSKKLQFLETAKDTARELENITGEFIEVQIGWIKSDCEDLPVTIMINHPNAWFGTLEQTGWNENVILNNLKDFYPVKEDYLILNELISQAYNNR